MKHLSDWQNRNLQGQSKARATAYALVLAETQRYGNALLPGAAETLAERWAPLLDNARAGVVAEHVSRQLANESSNAKFLNPAHVVDEAKTPLRRVFERYRDLLGSDAEAAAVYAGLAVEFAGYDEHRAAGELLRRLGNFPPRVRSAAPEDAADVGSSVPDPSGEAVMASPEEPARAVARPWEGEFGGFPMHPLALASARRLASPAAPRVPTDRANGEAAPPPFSPTVKPTTAAP